jgi:hypothetical protein
MSHISTAQTSCARISVSKLNLFVHMLSLSYEYTAWQIPMKIEVPPSFNSLLY